MNKCKQCNAVVNPKWGKCFACHALLVENRPHENNTNHDHITFMPLDKFGKSNMAIKVYSELLREEIWIVSNEEMKNKVADEGLVVFLPHEIQHLTKIRAATDEIKKIHMVKKTFLGSDFVFNDDFNEDKPDMANTKCEA